MITRLYWNIRFIWLAIPEIIRQRRHQKRVTEYERTVQSNAYLQHQCARRRAGLPHDEVTIRRAGRLSLKRWKR